MKNFVRDRFEEFVNKRNATVIRRNMTPDFADHDGPCGKPTGVDGDEQMMLGMYKAMPDLRLTIEDMIAEGDKVMCRNIWRWTDGTLGDGDASSRRYGLVVVEGHGVSPADYAVDAPTQSSSAIIAAYLDAVIGKDASAVDRYFDPHIEYMVNGTPVPDPTGTLPPISADCHAALP
jgi:hypothetical protein